MAGMWGFVELVETLSVYSLLESLLEALEHGDVVVGSSLLDSMLEALEEEYFLVGSSVLESLLEAFEREDFLGGSSFSADAFDLVFRTFSIMLSVFK